MRSWISSLIAAPAAVLLMIGCSQRASKPMTITEYLRTPASIAVLKTNYESAVQSGLRDLAPPREFNQLFPTAKNGISYFTGSYGPPTWRSEVGLHGRYVLKMGAGIKLNTARNKIISIKRTDYDLWEFRKITVRTNGSYYI